MKQLRLGVSAALVALMTLGCGRRPDTQIAGDTAFVGVNVIPMDSERVLENQVVVVADGRIVAIGSSDEIDPADGVDVVEATGQYLIPGLTEMHGHLPNAQASETDTQNLLFLYVANGVTTVRGMQGHPSQFELRDRIDRGVIAGPQLFLGSVAISGRRVSAPEQAAQLVREYQMQGYDLIKTLEGLSLETYDALARTAQEVGIPFGGHVPDEVGLRHALASGQVSIDHLDNFVEALVPKDKQADEWPGIGGEGAFVDRIDDARLPEVIAATVDAGAWVVPTMVLWETGILGTRPATAVLAERPEVQYMPPETVERWTRAVEDVLASSDVETARRLAALRRTILSALYEAGANIVLGTDSPQTFSVPGFSVHREMQLYVEIGMAPHDVLAIGTRNPAEYFGASEEFGTVAVGHRADLVLLTANPLDDIANVQRRAGVMVNGRWLPEAEIQKRLEAIAVLYGN